MQSLKQQNDILQHLVTIKNNHEPNVLRSRLGLMELQLANSRRGFGSTVLDYFLDRTEYSPSEVTMGGFQSRVHEAIYAEDGARKVGDTSSFGKSGFQMTDGRRATLQQALLAKLHYTGMEDRAETVAEAHKSTFH